MLSLMGAKFARFEGFLNVYLRPIIKECNEHLEDAPTKQSQAAGRILHAVAKSDRFVADKVVKGVFPSLLSMYRSSESIAKRRGLLEVFSTVINAYSEFESTREDSDVETLKESTDEAFTAMILALNKAPKQEVSFRLAALDGVAQLFAVRRLLSDDQIQGALNMFTKMILNENVSEHGSIRSEAISRLVAVATHAPDAARNIAVPAFMAQIPDTSNDESTVLPTLEAFVQLSKEPQLFDTVAVRLRSKLISARNQAASTTYQHALLLALLYAFEHGSPTRDEDGIIRSTYFTDFIDPLISSLKEGVSLSQDVRTLDIIGKICNVVLRPQGLHFQASVYNRNLAWLSPAHATPSMPTQRILDLAPFTLYYYAALRPDVVDPEDIGSLLKAHALLALDGTRDILAVSFILQYLALLVNKFIEPKSLQTTLQSANIEVEALLSSGDSAPSVGVAFAVVKALLIQGKNAILTKQYLEALLRLLASSEKSVARRFAGILAPEDILTKDNHCVISGLYKQKTSNQLVPPMIGAVRAVDAEVKPNYLIALSGILRWLPYSMIQSTLQSLIPALLQSLDLGELSDQEAKAPTLTIFESVLMHDSDVVTEHTASLITRLLNCTSGSLNGPKVRAKALQCLALVPRQLKREAVVPYRRQVVKKLMACLDDPKRDVRVEAVRCRTAWLALDEGGGDDE